MRGMSRGSVREYTEAIRDRYRRACKREKGVILDEFTQVTGYHRKAVIRLLGREHGPPVRGRGRPRQYGPGVVEALKVAWEAGDHLCGKRLKPFLVELVDSLIRHGELIPLALGAVRKGGTLALAGIYMTPTPPLPYELLYHERTLRSVANSTRQDVIELLEMAPKVPIRTEVRLFALEQANEALQLLKKSGIEGAGVLQIP